MGKEIRKLGGNWEVVMVGKWEAKRGRDSRLHG